MQLKHFERHQFKSIVTNDKKSSLQLIAHFVSAALASIGSFKFTTTQIKTQNKIIRQFLHDFNKNESIITVKLFLKITPLIATSNDAVKENSKHLQLYQKF